MSSSPYNRKVIINADDFGITKGVNKAILELVDAGVVTSTSVMSNMPHYKDILELQSKIGIGVHLNLTTGRPLLEENKVQTLVDEHGNFLNISDLIKKVRKGYVAKQDADAEFKAQVERLLELGIRLDHINSHESLLKYPFFVPIIKKIAKKYKIGAIRTYIPRKFDYTRVMNPKRILISLYLVYQQMKWKQNRLSVADKYDALIKFGLDYETAIGKLKDIFQNLPNGVLELGVHPGYCTEQNSILGSYVYEREVELQALLSIEFRKIIDACGAQLVAFNDI
jgi:hypothetical protein